MKNNKNKISDIDTILRKQVKEQLDRVPVDEWFVRKTLNRLPPRRRVPLLLPEMMAFVVAIIACVVIASFELDKMIDTAPGHNFDPTMLFTSVAVMLSATIYMVILTFRRCLN